MRKEPFTVGDYVHVIKRGTRGMDIVKDDMDRWRFLLMLNHFNDEKVSRNWFRELMDENKSDTLERASVWGTQKRLVNIISFCLLDNHFHLLLQEIKDGGVSLFMQGLGIGMAKYYNEKYEEKGSLFQGAYKSKTISDDRYLRYVSAYIQVKNTFEMYSGGFKKAVEEFDLAYEWAVKYPYSSLGHYAGVINSPIILDKDNILKEVFTPNQLKKIARDFVIGRADRIIEGEMKDVEFE